MATTFQKMIADLSSNTNVQKIVANFQQLSTELKKKEQDLKKRFDQEKDEKIALGLKKYKELIKTLNTSEKKLEKEVNLAIAKIKKSAENVEKNIAAYRKKAMEQADRIEKVLVKVRSQKASTAARKTTKKATKKKTARKATKKVARKTTKKASR